MSAGIPLNDDDRWPWLDIIRNRAATTLLNSQSFVVACSALKKTYRQRLCDTLADSWFVYLDGSRELITRRQSARRDHFMPSSLIASQFGALEVPVDEANVIHVSIDQSVDRVVAEALRKLHEQVHVDK